MGERAGSPCVGEPGRLSLDDKDRFKEDSDRLVCSRFDCFVIFRKRELRFLLEDKYQKTGSLCTSGYPRTLCIDRTGSALTEITLLLQGLKACGPLSLGLER